MFNYLEDGDIFRISKFIIYDNNRKIISNNYRLYYIQLNNKKCAKINKENYLIKIKLIKNLRSLS